MTAHPLPRGPECVKPPTGTAYYTSQLGGLGHYLVLSGPAPPTFSSFCKDVMSASMYRRPETHSGTHSAETKTTALVLTTVTAGAPGREGGLKDSYFNLTGGRRADRCCWQGEPYVQGGRCARPTSRKRISSVQMAQSLGFQCLLVEVHRERIPSIAQTIFTQNNCILVKDPGDVSLGCTWGPTPGL